AIGTLIDMGSSAYCAENTNTVGDDGIIQTKYSPAITSIVVSAEVCDENGNGLDLVRYNGMLYTKKSYINEILTTLNKAGNLNYYKDQNGTQQIDADCVELSEDASGYLLITLSNDDNNTYYVSSEGGNSSPIDGTVTLNTDQTSTAYTGGQMFYYIPIEHLNNPASGIEEAEYGVVRNHHYSVTITSLENIGRAVFDPSETIIPDDSWDEDEKYYYVGAVIDILSWKMVEKGVGL
ncbi:MAG: Mfa1 fimbrilin C-terminal domain-containing protein, partial [Prevotella sp.]|nr:Mfa1 fimbrilin C-terminal domain-containing protein [Prevotella sp.]